MPFALVLVGIMLVVVGARGTYAQFGAQVRQDFTGQKNFTVWILALFTVGAVGYAPQFRTFSRYFMALIIIALILSNKGFFQNLLNAIQSGPIAPAPTQGQGASASQSATMTNPITGGQVPNTTANRAGASIFNWGKNLLTITPGTPVGNFFGVSQ